MAKLLRKIKYNLEQNFHISLRMFLSLFDFCKKLVICCLHFSIDISFYFLIYLKNRKYPSEYAKRLTFIYSITNIISKTFLRTLYNKQ